jgi:hypothetical protein
MKDWWIKFGCFLTGYNYSIIRNSSEIAAKTVKRYTSALIIICIIWAFIGYTFTDRYLRAGTVGSIIGAIVMVTIIIQVERQIILATHKNWWLFLFRGLIALTMAIIGSIIIDQIIFKEDIEQQKLIFLDEKVNAVLPGKAQEIKRQITEIDSTILYKENEYKSITDDLAKNPVKKVQTKSYSNIPLAVQELDSNGNNNSKVVYKSGVTTNEVVLQNPRQSLLEPLTQQIEYLRNQKSAKDSVLLTLRPAVENEIRSKVGFLDELEIMWRLITNSKVALIVYSIWFALLLFLELFIVFSKIGEKDNDYDETIHHQMALQKKKLQLLAEASLSKN